MVENNHGIQLIGVMHVTPMASSNVQKLIYRTLVDIVEDENQIVNVNIVPNVWYGSYTRGLASPQPAQRVRAPL